MVRFALIAILAASGAASDALAQSWWLVDDGFLASYSDGTTLVVLEDGSSVLHDVTAGTTTDRFFYELSDDGDVAIVAMTRTWVDVEDHDGFVLDPPVIVVDLPLQTGKTWSQGAVLHAAGDPVGVVISYSTTVLGPRQVTVPAGTFDVIAAEVTVVSPSPLLPSGTRTMLLHGALGDVSGLVSWQGVVPAEPTAWGDVKALFR